MDLLYKYVSAERALTCLPEIGDGTLRATQPSALNDPFESSVYKLFVEQDEEEGNRRLSEVLTSINPPSPVSEDRIVEARDRFGSLYLRELLSEQLSQRFGIVSFSSDPRHPLMWSHYTVDGSGFVLAYDAESLRTLSTREGCLQQVRYGNRPIPLLDYPVLNESNMNALMSYKSAHWQYEQEWRLIVELNETIGTGQRDGRCQPINLLRVPNQAVIRVYYTERTPGATVEKIRERLANANNRYGTAAPTKLVMVRYFVCISGCGVVEGRGLFDLLSDSSVEELTIAEKRCQYLSRTFLSGVIIKLRPPSSRRTCWFAMLWPPTRDCRSLSTRYSSKARTRTTRT